MYGIDDLLDIVSQLRDPQKGCPWYLRQNFASVSPYTIEEAYEVANAIQRQNDAYLRDELGDLLLNIILHAQMAKELKQFTFCEVVDAACKKAIRRHPHVFESDVGENDLSTARACEQYKARESALKHDHQDVSALAGIALALPALVRAQKIGKQAAYIGFDWRSMSAVFEKIHEELTECEQARGESQQRLEEEIGDLLFTVTNLARHAGVDAETALKKASNKFQRRFEHVERLAGDEGRALDQCDADQLNHLWQLAKQAV